MTQFITLYAANELQLSERLQTLMQIWEYDTKTPHQAIQVIRAASSVQIMRWLSEYSLKYSDENIPTVAQMTVGCMRKLLGQGLVVHGPDAILNFPTCSQLLQEISS